MPQGQGFIKGADVYRSDDGGKSWRQTSRYDEATTNRLNNNSGTYGWVFGQIRVDPTTEDTIWIMGVPLSKSTDGGKTFTTVGGMHSDHHGLWIDPANTNIIYNANDGGFYQTADGGKTWRFAVTRRRRAVLQHRARHEHAVLGVRIHPGSRQLSWAGRSRTRPRRAVAGGVLRSTRR